MIIRLFSMLLAIGLLGVLVLSGGAGPSLYFGIEELITVVVVPLLVVAAVFGFKHFRYTFLHVMFQGGQIPREEVVRHCEFYRFYSDTILGLGVFWHLATMLLGLQNMEDPSSIGSLMAVSLMPLFYSVGISLLILGPLAKSMELLKNEGDRAGSSGANSILVAVAVSLLTASSFLFGMAKGS